MFALKCKRNGITFSRTKDFKDALKAAKVPFQANTTFYDAYDLVRSTPKGSFGPKATWKKKVDKAIREGEDYSREEFSQEFSSLKNSTKASAWRYYQEHKREGWISYS